MRVARRTVLGAGLGVGAMAWPGFAGAQGGPTRFGLVVGNTAYNSGVGELRNAGADADLVAGTLRACGFDVPAEAVVKNVTRLPLLAAVRAHAARVRAAGPQAVGFLYYAGHGAASASGRNYLIPLVSATEMTDALWDECVDLTELFEILGAAPPRPGDTAPPQANAHIVSLDACRNNLRLPGRSPGGAVYRQVHQADPNHFVSYSTWEGQTASDGDPGATNGPYALGLAAQLGVGGPSVVNMFDLVRLDVKARTRDVQEPMNLSRLNQTATAMRIARVTAPPVVIAPEVTSQTPANTQSLVMACTYSSGPLPPLATPAQDAARVNEALQRSGYVSAIALDPSRTGMMSAIRSFSQRLAQTRGGVCVFYFSGYGASYDGANYLLPSDARVEQPADLDMHGVPLAWVVSEIARAEPRAGVLILDCGRRFSPNVSPRGLQASFDPVSTPANLLVAYGASPGQLASDGGSEGSIFARAFVAEVLQPERRDLVETMIAVNRRVATESGGAQRPWFQTTVRSAPIYFRNAAAARRASIVAPDLQRAPLERAPGPVQGEQPVPPPPTPAEQFQRRNRERPPVERGGGN